MTIQKHCFCSCPHQWTQSPPFISNWVQETPSPKVCHKPIQPVCLKPIQPVCPKPIQPVCPKPIQPVTPNPIFPSTATLPICIPLQFEKTGSNSVLVTISVPSESVITLPTKALEIKMIRKNLKITQCRFFNCVPSVHGIPQDTPKLFLGGIVRKDIQYSEAVHQTATTVAGVMKDFVVDIPISCVIDLGRHLIFPPIDYNQQKEYNFAKSTSLPSGFSSKEHMLSCDLTEFNLLSQQYYNPLPTCELLFCQINEIDEALDRLPLHGGPLEECTFTTLQEKMILLIQLQLTFPTKIYEPDIHCDIDPNSNHCHTKHGKCKCPRSLIDRICDLLSRLTH